jgi:NADH:ubiquinone oxidoreductase subunit E
MDLCNVYREPEFTLEGCFLGFVRSDGKVKALKIQVNGSEFKIKLAKAARSHLSEFLVLGDWIQVFGKTQRKKSETSPKMKAYQVNKISQFTVSSDLENQLDFTANLIESTCSLGKHFPQKPKAKILVCQKSGCVKRGGKKLCQELEMALCERGLQNHVAIEQTGCLKRCSSAPNMVVMPGKTRCSKMQPNEVADLLVKRLSLSY